MFPSQTLHLNELPPLSLYIHIPWCIRKCPYCDFNSHTTDNMPEQQYIAALIADLDAELPLVQGRKLESIFFGGGTPSLFSAQSIHSILSAVEQRISFSPAIEITLEANPSTFEQQKFADYRCAGVNRLSIGVQSFQQQHLLALGRVHNNHEAVAAATTAKAAGFDNFNIDLMHGLPEQSSNQALADLQQAIDLGASHLSWYQLTIEPNTAFYSAPPRLPNDDCLADIQLAGEELLQAAQFHQYEISAYAKAGKQSLHNLNYWLFGDFIGIGAGAHGKLSSLVDPAKPAITRRWKTRSPKDYLENKTNFLGGEKQLTRSDLPLEFLMNSLRLNKGFPSDLFEQRTGLKIDSIKHNLHELVDRQLLLVDDQRISPSPLGRKFLNDILAEFTP